MQFVFQESLICRLISRGIINANVWMPVYIIPQNKYVPYTFNLTALIAVLSLLYV